mgnify:CR=1 FL=1
MMKQDSLLIPCPFCGPEGPEIGPETVGDHLAREHAIVLNTVPVDIWSFQNLIASAALYKELMSAGIGATHDF